MSLQKNHLPSLRGLEDALSTGLGLPSVQLDSSRCHNKMTHWNEQRPGKAARHRPHAPATGRPAAGTGVPQTRHPPRLFYDFGRGWGVGKQVVNYSGMSHLSLWSFVLARLTIFTIATLGDS